MVTSFYSGTDAVYPLFLRYAPNQISERNRPADLNVMIPLLIIFAVSAVAGIVVLVVSSENAPEGYQSESGFHYGSQESVDSSVAAGQAISGKRTGVGMDRVAARTRI